MNYMCTVEYIADMQDIGVIANIKYKKVFGRLPHPIIGKFKNFRFRPFYGKKVISVFKSKVLAFGPRKWLY